MRCGMTLFIQGYEDWDRYLARERGEAVPDLDPELDRQRLSGEIETALMAEDLGFDSLWTVEHHVSPYTMIPNPLQLLTFFAGATTRMDMGTMVVVLPWHHPLRVAEDITLLQYALRGPHAVHRLRSRGGAPRVPPARVRHEPVQGRLRRVDPGRQGGPDAGGVLVPR